MMILLLCLLIFPTNGSERLFNLSQDLDSLMELESSSLSPQMRNTIFQLRSETVNTFSIVANLQTELANVMTQNAQYASLLMSTKSDLDSCTESLSKAHIVAEQFIARNNRNIDIMQEKEKQYKSAIKNLEYTVAFYDDLFTGKEQAIDDEVISDYQNEINPQASEIGYLQSIRKSRIVLVKNIPKGTLKEIISTVIFPEAIEIHMLPWERGSIHGQTALVKFADWERTRKHIEWFRYARLRRIAMDAPDEILESFLSAPYATFQVGEKRFVISREMEEIDTDSYTSAGILFKMSQGGVNLPFAIEKYF